MHVENRHLVMSGCDKSKESEVREGELRSYKGLGRKGGFSRDV
jgi:hypothetical protein